MEKSGNPPAQLVSPSDEDLGSALKTLRQSNPTTGAAKLLPLLLDSNPGWAVSEKRLRKVLQKEGLSLAVPANPNNEEYPISKIIPSLEVSTWSKKVRVEDFGVKKGKGLVATESIDEGENLWLEDPLVFAPESSVQLPFVNSFFV